MADDGKSCASCGNPLPAGLPMKVCPACLLGRGLSMMSGERTRVKVGDFVPPEPEDLELIFPDFRVKRLIGRGGMGAVYQAEQVDLEREVAVKILPPEVAGDEEFRERFRREAATLAQLDHPNIVKLFDYGEREGYFYFVMEYVEGADLADRMKDGEFSMAQILSVISQVCDALDDAHGQGVVHRDIKPGNILIDETGRTKIVHENRRFWIGQGGGRGRSRSRIDENTVVDGHAAIHGTGADGGVEGCRSSFRHLCDRCGAL